MKKPISIIFSDLKKAYQKLQEIDLNSKDEIIRDASIQRFEFTFELSWKLMQKIAIDQGMESFGMKNTIRNAAQLKLIDDPTAWIRFVNYRNTTSHSYTFSIAKTLFSKLPEFLLLVEKLINTVQNQVLEI